MYIEDVLVTMRRVTQKVRAVSILRALVQIKIFLDQTRQLGRDVGNLVAGKFIFLKGNLHYMHDDTIN